MQVSYSAEGSGLFLFFVLGPPRLLMIIKLEVHVYDVHSTHSGSRGLFSSFKASVYFPIIGIG